jgi:hypothetical protein
VIVGAPTRDAAGPSTGDLVRRGAVAGVVAALATTAVAAGASVADVDLEVDGEAVPVAAFAWWTLVATALGVLLARLLRRRGRFLAVATVLVGLSLVPPITAPDDTATTVVLVGAHLVAAAIIVPTLARQLDP